jgi:hypothetical protein
VEVRIHVFSDVLIPYVFPKSNYFAITYIAFGQILVYIKESMAVLPPEGSLGLASMRSVSIIVVCLSYEVEPWDVMMIVDLCIYL